MTRHSAKADANFPPRTSLAKVPMSELDVEPIAAEAGVTPSRFYAYYTFKYDALAALLRRMVEIRKTAIDQPGQLVYRPVARGRSTGFDQHDS